MYNSQEIASIIKKTAKEKNITVKQLLEKCNLNINTISELSKGKQISYVNFAIIADNLGVSVDYLLGRTETPNSQIITTGDINNNIRGDNNSNHVNVGNTQLSDDTRTLVEMIQDLPLLERSKVVVMIDEMRKGA